MQEIVIIPSGVCCDRIVVSVDGQTIKEVQFEGGCIGNGRALGRLLAGMPVDRAMELLRGVQCDDNETSCADQFARGLERELSAQIKA